MDWFRDHVGVGVTYAIMDAAANATSPCHQQQKQKSMANFFDPVIQVLDTPAYANLTTDYCKNHFNPNTPDDPSVAYYSYGANTAIPPWTFLGMTWQVVNEREGDNDGIVSVESAKWGKYIKTLDAHHWNLNGQRFVSVYFESNGCLFFFCMIMDQSPRTSGYIYITHIHTHPSHAPLQQQETIEMY